MFIIVSVRPSVCCLCMSVYSSVQRYVSPHVNVCQSARPSIYPFVCMFVHRSICPSVRASVRPTMTVHLSVCPSIHPPVRLFCYPIRSSVCPSAYPSIALSRYLAHLGYDRCLPDVTDVHDSLETTTDTVVVVQHANVGFKLETCRRLQTSTDQHHPLHTHGYIPTSLVLLC